MRSFVLRNRMDSLLRMSSIGVLGVLVAGCSSGFERFDHFYNSAVPQQNAQAANPYPGNVDPLTTASASSALKPLQNVLPSAVPQGVYHAPEPTYAQKPVPIYQAPQPYKPYAQAQPAYQSLDSYRPQASSWGSSTQSQIKSSSLPSVNKTTAAVAKTPVYVPPRPDEVSRYTSPTQRPAQSDTVYIPPSKPDLVTTASLAPQPSAPTVAPVVQPKFTAQTGASKGWTSAGGTTISARSGETLYNLSKRYGVPVAAIREANGMAPGASLQAGQKVLIPNYVFSPTAAVSAPDYDSGTRAARASTGYFGEADPATVPIPTNRPYYVSAIAPSGTTQDASTQRYTPKTHVEPPSKENVPDYSITTGSVAPSGGTYTVQSGDSLSKISRDHGVSVANIQRANGLTGTSIRLGQKLIIPTAGSVVSTTVASAPAAKPLPANVDPVVTGSVATAAKEEAPAPARTGISNFRWPVNGRVISGFGASTSSGKNEGIDISVPEGTAVKAAENGVVIYAGSEISSYGNLILVRHADDWVSAYAHNKNFEVKKGDRVSRGQTIARSGKTGDAERPKLHFELRKNSVPVNPNNHLAG